MADDPQVVHLILVNSGDRLGMEDLMQLVAKSLRGDVIELRPVPSAPPPEIPPHPPLPVPVKRWARAKAPAGLNVRAGPTTTSASLGLIYPADEYEVLAESAGWYQIRLRDGRVGWVSGQWVTVRAA